MTRNMDLLRDILLLAQAASAGEPVRDFSSLGFDHPTVVEHIRLARDSALLEAALSGPNAIIWRLTPQGHDFVEQAQKPEVWEETKSTFREKGIGFTVELASRVMQGIALRYLGMSP